jgi:hypothetical protein
MPETVELLIGGGQGRRQPHLLRLPIGAEDSPLGHGDAGDHEVGWTDRDAARRADSLRMLWRAHSVSSPSCHRRSGASAQS